MSAAGNAKCVILYKIWLNMTALQAVLKVYGLNRRLQNGSFHSELALNTKHGAPNSFRRGSSFDEQVCKWTVCPCELALS